VVPLVSVPDSPSVCSAASAPPEFTLSAVVKYELPRFFGITKTLRPVFRPPLDALAEEEEEAAADVAGVEEVDEEEEDDEQAARAGATNKSGRASHVARLSLIVCILSIFCLMFGRVF
jgi:hypothetical protein